MALRPATVISSGELLLSVTNDESRENIGGDFDARLMPLEVCSVRKERASRNSNHKLLFFFKIMTTFF